MALVFEIYIHVLYIYIYILYVYRHIALVLCIRENHSLHHGHTAVGRQFYSIGLIINASVLEGAELADRSLLLPLLYSTHVIASQICLSF